MWEVEIEEKYQSNIKYLSEGVYRVYLSGNHLGFIRLGSVESVFELPVSDVTTHIYVQLCMRHALADGVRLPLIYRLTISILSVYY